MSTVTWGRAVDKQLSRIPELIVRKFRIWVIERDTGKLELVEVVEVNKHDY